MAGRVLGFAATRAVLAVTGLRISKAVNDQLESEARAIRDLARAYVPVDAHDMERAIVVESGNRRQAWQVGVDESRPDDTGRYTVGDYLAFLHDGDYNLGPNSEAKGGIAAGVGPKFLERAFQERLRSGLAGRLQIAINRVLRARGVIQ